MVSIMEIMQLCRLCLVKEQVNVPIFDEQGDIRQICLKITACLPVKVSKEDKLPKKICDGCLYKLELLYQFYNTTANAEKQLLSWIEQAKMDSKNAASELATQPQTTVKQEKLEPVESTNETPELSNEAQNYILQQQQLQYQSDFPFKESQGSNADEAASNASANSDEPIAKRARRRRQATKPIPPEAIDSSDDNDAGDSMMEMTVTKTEEESESDGDDNVDDPEPEKYVAVGDDTDQPGPSGLGKGSTDTPLKDSYPLETLEYKYTYNSVDDSYACSTCDNEVKTKNEIELHVLMHEDKFLCDVCKEVFRSANEFLIHLRRHTEELYKCPLCDYRTNGRTSISNHINLVHLKKFSYHCQFCGKGFQDAAACKEHENTHTGADPLACVVCKKKFPFKTNLLIHQVQNHTVTVLGSPMKTPLKQYVSQIRNHKVTIVGIPLKNKCPHCRKTYSKVSSLQNHMKVHDKNRPQPKTNLCDICGKGFAQKGKLDVHYRVHTGYKPYKCNYCDKSFTKKDYLVMHERIHTGEKPYSCVHCGKSFNQDASLRIHVRTHTGEKPYTCQICEGGFVSKAAVKVHMNNCTGSCVK